jgi:hypothetical protein
MRQPPEKVLVGIFCIAAVKPRPKRIDAARGSALSACQSFRSQEEADKQETGMKKGKNQVGASH